MPLIYLSTWEAYEDEAGSCFRPTAHEGGWIGGVRDLRPDASVVDGYCLIVKETALDPVPPGVWLLRDGWDTQLQIQISRRIETELGIPRDILRNMTIRQACAALAFDIPNNPRYEWTPRPRNDGHTRLIVGSEVLFDEQTHPPRPSTQTYTESFGCAAGDLENGCDLSWVRIVGAANSLQLDGAGEVQHNGTDATVYNANAIADTDDNYAELTVTDVFRQSGTVQLAAVCRAPAATFGSNNADGYLVQLNRSTGNLTWNVRKMVDNVRTDLTSAEIITPSLPEDWKIEANGNELQAYRDGSPLLGTPLEDNSISTGKYGGIYAYRSTTNNRAKATYFEFGDIAAAGGDMSGTSAGSATAAGTLKGTGAIGGTATAVATVTGSVQGIALIEGTAAGIASTSGVIAGSGKLQGASAGLAITEGALKGVGALAGQSAGAAVVTGTMEQPSGLEGVSAGAATISGTLTGVGALAGTSAGQTTTTADLRGWGSLAGAAEGSATVSGTLNLPAGEMVGQSAGSAAVSGQLIGTGALVGAADGAATTIAILTGSGALAGQSSGAATVSGVIDGLTGSSGISQGTATVSGTLTGTGNLLGLTAGGAVVSGLLTGWGALQGLAEGTSTASLANYIASPDIVYPVTASLIDGIDLDLVSNGRTKAEVYP